MSETFSGPVLDAGIFDGVPETYTCHLPEFYILTNARDPFSPKRKFIWDLDRSAWVWESKWRSIPPSPPTQKDTI